MDVETGSTHSCPPRNTTTHTIPMPLAQPTNLLICWRTWLKLPEDRDASAPTSEPTSPPLAGGTTSLGRPRPTRLHADQDRGRPFDKSPEHAYHEAKTTTR